MGLADLFLKGTGQKAAVKSKTIKKGIKGVGEKVLGVADTVAETAIPGYARKKEAAAQRDAQKDALGLQREMFDYAKETQQPWLEHGQAALGQLSQKTLGGEFDTPITRWDYGRLPYEQHGYEGIDRGREYDQIPIERGYEALDPQRYESKPWDISQLAQDPGYQFRMKQGQEAITSAAGAGGNRLSGGTLKALADYGQGLASQEAGRAYERHARDRAFDYGADQDYQAAQRGERAFKYGTGQDYLANLAGERGFKYGTGRDYIGDLERERAFKYGAGQDYLSNLAGERAFNYGADQDYQNRFRNEMQDRYNRLAGLSGTGQQTAGALGSMGMQAGSQMGDTIGNIGMARGMSAMAGQRGLMDLLNLVNKGGETAGGLMSLGTRR